MSDSSLMASSASLLTTNTSSSSFDPTKSNKTKQPRGQKDYAAALSTLQSKYGLHVHDSSALSIAIPPPSKKQSLTPTPKSSPVPAMCLATTSSSGRRRDEWSKRNQSSPLSMLRAKCHPCRWLGPLSPRLFSALPEGGAQEANNDGSNDV